ncbi:hypothetical protein D6C84_08476 [Aureobasidium pullulans]|uniref:Uncharacterized protein n=1 Tax=Aureobasidium pullulans TaxID=5580 RepID=A0A4S9XE21_AURPU|nr:hypothetical protein D6C84_08476 [Aureobasidium pullulans]
MAHQIRTLLKFVPGCAVNNYIGSGHEHRWIEEQLELANTLYLKYNEPLLRMQHFSTLMKRVKDRVRREQKEKKCKTKFRVEKAQFTKCKNKDKKQRMIAKHLELLDDAIKITETYVNDPSRNHITSNIRLARNFFAILMTESPGFIDDEVEEGEVSEGTNSEEVEYDSEYHDLDVDD